MSDLNIPCKCKMQEEIKFLLFWECGVRYFTILGPNGERVEYNQRLTENRKGRLEHAI